MGIPRRLTLILSSIFVLLILAISLATSLQARAPPHKLLQISLAQAANVENADRDPNAAAGSKINDTDFDRADILSGTSTIYPHQASVQITLNLEPTSTMNAGEGLIGETPSPRPTPMTIDEGIIGPKPTSTLFPPTPSQPATPATLIIALTYSGSGGPKHCRGSIVGKLSIPDSSAWKNGSCVNLPSMARCGVFFAGKEDGCEAQLFNMPSCLNETKTYVNTVVFMPEERPVGALWRSMFVRCGVVAPEARILDPALLGGVVRPAGKGGG